MREITVPSVRELIDCAVEKYGKKTFIEYFENNVLVKKSYKKIREDSLAVCRYLRAISKDHLHIALCGSTSYEYLVFATASLISGCVLVPFAPDISASEASNLFKRADIDLIVHDAMLEDKVDEIINNTGIYLSPVNMTNKSTFNRILSDYSESSEYASLSDYEVDMDELALIIFTSGTTGIKKGVMHSTRTFVANTMCTDYVPYTTEKDTLLSVLPMYHVFCFSGDYVKNIRDGVTVALNGNMRNLTRNLLAFQPTAMRVVPMIAQTLLRAIKSLHAKNPSLTPRQAAEAVYGKNIKWLISGGAYLPPELCVEYENYGIYLRQGYGMSEAGCRITIPDTICSLDSVGRVIDICDVRIQGGEIQVNTPSAMLGYYKMPEETKEMFTEDGWLRTGDIGVLAENDELFITGRLKNLIILSSGENVSPEAIEKKFNDIESISEVLVYAEKNMIVADIYPNYSYFEDNKIENPEEVIISIVKEFNKTSKASHTIAKVNVLKTPLERTGSGKIKRKVNSL